MKKSATSQTERGVGKKKKSRIKHGEKSLDTPSEKSKGAIEKKARKIAEFFSPVNTRISTFFFSLFRCAPFSSGGFLSSSYRVFIWGRQRRTVYTGQECFAFASGLPEPIFSPKLFFLRNYVSQKKIYTHTGLEESNRVFRVWCCAFLRCACNEHEPRGFCGNWRARGSSHKV